MLSQSLPNERNQMGYHHMIKVWTRKKSDPPNREKNKPISLLHHPLTLFPSRWKPSGNPLCSPLMSSAASPCFSPAIPVRRFRIPKSRRIPMRASGDPASGSDEGKPVADTRIHWSNPDDGWIGGSRTRSGVESNEKKDYMGARFADLINKSSASHYQFLGVGVEADMEEIRTAYRRLSKEYHPDTTSLPLKTASEKFMQLREAYNVLSKEESRRFYDWTLAQEAESRRAERMRMKLVDPFEEDVRNYEPVPDMVDRLGGKNLKLSDQALTALTFDILAIGLSICCIIYVAFFKEPY